MSLLRNKHKQEQDGTNPICMFFLQHIIVFGSIKGLDEQIIAQANTKPITKEDVNSLPALSHSVRSLRTIPPPTKVHNAKHITIDDFYASGAHDTHERYQAPPPQRPKGDGSGRIYTKSPDYTKNYEKTRPRIANDQTGRV